MPLYIERFMFEFVFGVELKMKNQSIERGEGKKIAHRRNVFIRH